MKGWIFRPDNILGTVMHSSLLHDLQGNIWHDLWSILRTRIYDNIFDQLYADFIPRKNKRR